MHSTLRGGSLQDESNKNDPDLKYHLEVSQKMAHIGSWELDLTNTDLDAPQYWSDETYRILGYEPGGVIPSFNTFLNSVHPDDRPSVQKAAALTIKEGKEYDIEHRHIMPDGRITITRCVAQLVKDKATGAPLKLCGAMKDITDKKETYQALERANIELGIFFEKINEVLYSVDMQQYKLLQMSAACEKVYGYTVAEMKQNPNQWMDAILEEDRHIIYSGDAAMRRGEVVANEYRIYHKDGRIRWLGGTLTPTLDENGALLRIDGVVSDITARKEAELALKDSELKFRTLLENSSDGIAITNRDRKIVFASSSMVRITGYSHDELIEVEIASLFHPDDLPVLFSTREKLLASPGNTAQFAVRFRKKEGNWIWLEGVTQNLLHDPAICGFVTNYRDITDRIEAEAALRSSELKFRALIEKASEGMAVSNEHLELTYVSESMLRLTGYTEEEVKGTQVIQYFHPEDAPKIEYMVSTLANMPGNNGTFLIRFRKKNGTYIWTEGFVTNLLHEPAVNGFVTNFRDVTERIEHEEALKGSNEHLKKINNELDRFVYSVSHDLRAPLASILGAIDFTESETHEPEVLQNLHMMKSSVRKLDGFIQDILDYSRNSRLEVKKEKINFTELVTEAINNLKFMSHGNGNVAMRLNVEDCKTFYSDRSRLYIVLNNLISNAIRYHDPTVTNPYVAVDVVIEPTEALITIRDNGTGIDKKFHDRVFDMFYRVSKKSVGSGLGLYIVKETVEKLSGKLELDSEPGVGTEFRLRIPNFNV